MKRITIAPARKPDTERSPSCKQCPGTAKLETSPATDPATDSKVADQKGSGIRLNH